LVGAEQLIARKELFGADCVVRGVVFPAGGAALGWFGDRGIASPKHKLTAVKLPADAVEIFAGGGFEPSWRRTGVRRSGRFRSFVAAQKARAGQQFEMRQARRCRSGSEPQGGNSSGSPTRLCRRWARIPRVAAGTCLGARGRMRLQPRPSRSNLLLLGWHPVRTTSNGALRRRRPRGQWIRLRRAKEILPSVLCANASSRRGA